MKAATYNANSNQFEVSGGCTDTGGTLCQASYSFMKHPPAFDGTGHDSSCMKNYASSIFNYHNHAGCASDSGLFTWSNGGPSDAKPQLLGKYTEVADETLFLVRRKQEPKPYTPSSATSFSEGDVCGSDAPRSCKDIESVSDGDYLVCAGAGTNKGTMTKVYCLQSWNGGGWTGIARALAPGGDSYNPLPPTIVRFAVFAVQLCSAAQPPSRFLYSMEILTQAVPMSRACFATGRGQSEVQRMD